MVTFSPRKFPDLCLFLPLVSAPDSRGSVGTGTGAGVAVPAYLEPGPDWADRAEGHGQPEARKKWNVFTPSDPGAAADSAVSVPARGMTLTVVKSGRLHGAAALWRTECLEVT